MPLNSQGSVSVANMLNDSHFGIYHLNIQCLTNKIDELSLFLDTYKFDILGLSEHWIDNREILDKVNIIGYKLVSSYCRTAHRHGGVLIFAKNNLKCKPLQLDEYCVEMHAEFCGLEIPSQKLRVILLYRPSTSRDFHVFLDQLEAILVKYTTDNINVIILGDFSKDFNVEAADLRSLKYLVSTFNLTAQITDFTRVTDVSSTTIDNILTNVVSEKCISGVLDSSLSDHAGQFILFSCEANSKTADYSYSRPVTSVGIKTICEHLSNKDWSVFLRRGCDVNNCRDDLVNTFDYLIKRYLPIRKYSKANINWFTEDLKKQRNHLMLLKEVFNHTKNETDKSAYNIYRSHYKKAISEANVKRTPLSLLSLPIRLKPAGE